MKEKVLIVDDDPKMGKLINFRLSKAGFEPEYFNNGEEALKNITSIKPDLIISDIEMPEMDGYEFCERVRQDPDTAGIPFIFLSGKTDTSDQLEGFRLGADDYVCKPLKFEYLLERIEKVLARAAKARSFKSKADFSGNLSQMNLNDVMQIVETNRKNGELVFFGSDNKPVGKIFFEKGNLVNAQLENLEGVEAFFGLMGLEEGHFEFFGREIEVPKKITISNMAALLKGSRLLDESRSLPSLLPNMDVKLAIKTGDLPPSVLERAGKEKLHQVVMMIKEGRTVSQIIESGLMSRQRAATIIVELFHSEIAHVREDKPVEEKKPITPSELSIEKWLIKAMKNIGNRQLTGILEIEDRSTRQAVYFQDGQIIHAFHGNVIAKKALYRIFADKGGAPKFQPQPVMVEKTINDPLETLIDEGNREVEMLKELRDAAFNNLVTVNTSNINRVSKVNRPGLKDVLALVHQYGRVQNIIDASPMTDLRTYNHLHTLVRLEIINIHKGSAQ